MIFYRQSSVSCLSIFVIVLGVVPWLAHAQEVTMMSDQRLTEARMAFSEQKAVATASLAKQSTLLQSLDAFDARVEEAKKAVDVASKQGSYLSEKIRAQEELLSALASQRRRIEQERGDVQVIALSFHDDLRAYARLAALRDIAYRESGPVFAGSLLRPLLHSSLGESVDDFIERHAVLRARRQLVDRLKIALVDTRIAEERLHAVAGNVQRDFDTLLAEKSTVDAMLRDQQSFIDSSWKEKKLTEQELRAAQAEASESSDKLAEAQAGLETVAQQLKQLVMAPLRSRTRELTLASENVDKRREELQRKDAAMLILMKAADTAYAQAMAARNTDKKLYRRIEERAAELAALTAQRERGLVDASDGMSERPMTDNERSTLTVRIDELSALIDLMKQGIPEEQATAYYSRKKTALDAAEERKVLATELQALQKESAKILAEMSKNAVAIEQAEQRYLLDDLPPSFVWPVVGPITAGFLDAAYEKVFHFAHRAIDIAVPQGTTVRSIADGVVLAVRDGGAAGYSYVLIGHRHGFASLYGHVSSFIVSAGDLVSMGQPIARSGGQPGTHGAGKSTTGPHVHLEITKDGQHIDPHSVLR